MEDRSADNVETDWRSNAALDPGTRLQLVSDLGPTPAGEFPAGSMVGRDSSEDEPGAVAVEVGGPNEWDLAVHRP